MKFYLVNKVVGFDPKGRIDSFHYTMFHGLARRSNPSDRGVNLIEFPLASSLILTLNTHRPVSIIESELNLVAREDVAARIAGCCDVRLSSVEIEGVANIPFAEGSMTHWETPGYSDDGEGPQRILRARCGIERLHWTGLNLQEVVPHDGRAMAARLPAGLFDFQVSFAGSTGDYSIAGSTSALETVGMLWSDGVHVLAEHVFHQIGDCFHRDYFEVLEHSL